jgi:hypothetical protein
VVDIRGPDDAEATRQSDALRGKTRDLNEFALRNGYFAAFEKGLADGRNGAALFRRQCRGTFDSIHRQVVEAEGEIARLAAVLTRMKATVDQGRRRKDVTLKRLGDSSEFLATQRELLALQGWVASLVETYVTILMFFGGSVGASRKVADLNASLNAIIQRNVASGGLKTGNSDLMGEMTQL